MAKKKQSAPVEPPEKVINLDGPLLIRIMCRKRIKNNKPVPPVDTPDAMYDVCDGVFEGAASDILSSSEIVRCPKCKQEFSQGMRATFSGDRIVALVNALNADCMRATSRNPVYIMQLVRKDKPNGPPA